MGMARLHRVDRLGEWAVVQGSITWDDKQILAVHQTPQGYQLVEIYLLIPSMESEKVVTQYFIEKLPDAPPALFTCLEQTWFPGRHSQATGEPGPVYELAYIGTDNMTTQGITQINSVHSDGSSPRVILSEPMLIMNLVSSPDGEKLAFWGCPGSIAFDCIPPEEDLDVWVVNWDGSGLTNLTENSAQSDMHPDWSPDSLQIVFDSDRSGTPQIYIMDADGGNLRALTNDSLQNTQPRWSPDGKWIAYHCREDFETRICVISPDGVPTGNPIFGIGSVWSPSSALDGMRLAFGCTEGNHSDICVAEPDGSNLLNLTNSPEDEHSPSWSPDGNWIAFVSNRNNDIDIYKLCVTCPGEPKPVRLTDEPRAAGWPFWSPDPDWIAYADVAGNDLMLVKADRSQGRFIASGVFGPPIWRP
jgi:Tol biopolymer transport system component